MRKSFPEGTHKSAGKLVLRLSVTVWEFFIAVGTGLEGILLAGTETGL